MIYLISIIAVVLLPYAKILPGFETGEVYWSVFTIVCVAGFGFLLFGMIFAGRRINLAREELALLPLALVYAISTLNSPSVLEAGFLAFHGLFIPAVLMILVSRALNTERRFRTFLRWFFGSFSIFAAVSVITFIVTGTRASPLEVPSISAATVLFLLFSMVIFQRCKKNRLICFGGKALVIIGIFSTIPRVYLLFVIGAKFIRRIITKIGALNSFLILHFASLLATVLLAVNSDALLGKVEPTSGRETNVSLARLLETDAWWEAIAGRADSYAAILSGVQSHWIFGSGLYRGEVNITIHNYHLQWLEYGGVVGYLFFFLFFLVHFAKISRPMVRDIYVSGGLYVLLGVLANGVFNGIMHGLMPHILFLAIGINIARINLIEQNKKLSNRN